MAEVNFGMVEIDCSSRSLTLSARGLDGRPRISKRVTMESLRLPGTGR